MPFALDPVSALGETLRQVVDVVVTLLPILLVSLLVFVLWRSLQAMPRPNTKAIKPYRGKTVGWSDVAGLEEATAELSEIVELLRDPGRFRKLGVRVPRGVLLHGPPGTGKTLLARAVAGESGAAFFSQSASAFDEVYTGLGAARIRKLFEAARKHAPAIVFIDELDAVGVTRIGSASGEQALNQLLVELDGFASMENVVVMASTNRLDSLDRALLRPGRFDRQVLVAPPDLAGRRAILEVHTRKKPLAPEVDLEDLARTTAGLTGADLENLCNEAAIRAGRAHRQSVLPRDFDDALERVVAGLQTRRRLGEREKRVIAYHEAGHALVSRLTNSASPVQKVTIVPRGVALGYTLNLPEEDRFLNTKEELGDEMAMLLGGRAAEQLVFGRISNGAANDLERVTAIARAMVYAWGMGEIVTSRVLLASDVALSEETKRLRDAEQARLCDAAYERALDLLARHREPLDRLAAELLARETLDRAELEALLADVEPESAHAREIGTVLATRERP